MADQKIPSGIWATREASEARLAEPALIAEATLIESAFLLIDECINMLASEQLGHKGYAQVVAVAPNKARRLSFGCFSLVLEGLGQEGGALLRPLMEWLSVLEFIRKDPARAELAFEGRLPKAGKIAQEVAPEFRGLRQFLSKNASHYSFSPESFQHVLNPSNGTINPVDLPNHRSLAANVQMVLIFLNLTMIECHWALQISKVSDAENLLIRIEGLLDETRDVLGESQEMTPAS